MKSKWLVTAAAALTALFCTSCAKDLVVEEILQVSLNQKIYTAYNIWYDNPDRVESINYLKGSVLPFGTEVEIIEATDKEIKFRTVADNKMFRILFERRYRMQSAQDYIRELFTTEDFKTLTEGVSLLNVEKLRRGLIDKGMTKREIRLAYGPPCKFKTPDESLNTWLYWTELLVGKRILFSKGKVTEIIVL